MTGNFEEIWKAYRRGKARPALTGDGKSAVDFAGGTPFDGNVKIGDVRIFADTNRPFVALLVEDRGLAGFRIVPVSPFREAASGREIEIGGRVYQAWNAAAASRLFVSRSWLVDEVDAATLASVKATAAAAHPGRVSAGDSVLANYEREFLVSGGDFALPWSCAPRKGVFASVDWFRAARLAASAAVCIGAFYLILGPARERIGVWREKAYEVAAMEGVDELELAGAEEESGPDIESIEDLSVFAEFLPGNLVAEGSPAIPDSTRPVQTAPVAVDSFSENTRLIASMRFMPIRRPDEGAFENPFARPLSVLDTGPFGGMSDINGSGGSSGGAANASHHGISLSNVTVRIVECPWNPEALLLNVKAGEVADGTVEVFFDKALVRAYRVLGGAGSRPLDAWYEFLPVAGAGEGAEFCRVTARTPVPGGDRRRVIRVVKAEPKDFDAMPSPLRRASPFAPPVDTNDVPVEVIMQ